MKNDAREVNFDGLVGPTHNYSGLSYGNVASLENQQLPSNPREAALQGLEKMKFLADKGILQAVLPPHQRPHIPTLRALGFTGNTSDILAAASHQAPDLLLAASSAAAMWTANAATISPSADSLDGKVHLTPANLTSKFHRSIESETTKAVLKAVFKDPHYFMHHDSLPAFLADEGAANHTRFCRTHATRGIQLFVYGRDGLQANALLPQRYPARQTYEASRSISRLHALDPHRAIFAQQHPDAIDAGAFHNDVVSVGNENLFFYHEKAFVNRDKTISEIKTTLESLCHTQLIPIEVKASEISLKDAIATYLFNSQIITLPNSKMMLLAPIECQENATIRTYLESLAPISEVHYLNLRQSMRNGGGPACLRLRIVLTPQEIAAVHPGVFLSDKLYLQLKAWIGKYYRDRLEPRDLADPLLLEEGYRTLEELTQILQLGPIYPFQNSLKLN